jgi:transposase-like protein
MDSPHCASTITNEQTQKTTLGYRTFRCSACKRRFNERTGTPFNFLDYPTDVVLLVMNCVTIFAHVTPQEKRCLLWSNDGRFVNNLLSCNS